MINKYPLWKNLLIIFVVCLGALYALPNLYVDDYAVQISGLRGKTIDPTVLERSTKILQENNIQIKGHSLDDEGLLFRLENGDAQLIAKDKLESSLGQEYSVALNLAPTTPNWLAAIGGAPMRLGLDLRGGVRFLMEIDMNTAINKILDSLQGTLKSTLVNAGAEFANIAQDNNNNLVITFADSDKLVKARQAINSMHPDLKVENNGNKLLVSLTDQKLTDARSKAVEQNITILRKRVDELGVAEPIIQRQGSEKIVVELPGVQDTARAKEILGATATLEFRLVNTNVDPVSIQNGIVPFNSEVKYTREQQPLVLFRKAVLGGEHISDASSGNDENGRPQVNISLDNDGGKKMMQATKFQVGTPMATVYSEYKDTGKRDDKGKIIMEKHEEVINVATINSVLGSSFRITGISSTAEAVNLAVLLRSGALIAPIQIVEEKTIGPSLGADNIQKGLNACLGGLLLSALFMIIYYRKFGLIANCALVANLVLLVALMSSLPGATLSMPGIAGIVLAMAMALDANILIYERIKEEQRNGLSIPLAIDHGYTGAFSSIFDANLTTILKAVVLYILGTGPVKGFAVTLILGVSISMFTAIIGSRAIVNWRYGGNKKITKLSI